MSSTSEPILTFEMFTKELPKEINNIYVSYINDGQEKEAEQFLLRCYKEALLKNADREKKIISLAIMVTNYLDNAKQFHKMQPFFFDRTGMFWFWQKEKSCWERVDETDLINSIEYNLGLSGQTVTGQIKNNYFEVFKRVGRMNIPKDAPKEWVQFKNKIFNIKTKEIIEASAEYFVCNPIPFEIGQTEDTPVLDKLFVEWVGEKYKQTLYEILAYACYTDYPIHIITCFVGAGRNGKSSFQKIIKRFIGIENICSTDLDALGDSRFECAKLFKKLVCIMGETNFGIMDKTSRLKQLTGQDLIGYEFKNKTPFDDYNYAKLIVSSNSLPTTDDRSEGFYRRWLILNWVNEFPEGKDIIEIIPLIEFNNLAKKIIRILPELLERGSFTNQGSIEERKIKYELASNPIRLFIDTYCEQGDYYILSSDFYKVYCDFLRKIKARVVKRSEFKLVCEEEGLYSTKKSHRVEKDGFVSYDNNYWVDGIRLKDNVMLSGGCGSSGTLGIGLPLIFPVCENECKTIEKSPKNPTKLSEELVLTDSERIISFLKQSNAPQSTNSVLTAVGGDELKLFALLESLRFKGDVFNPNPDKWLAL